MDYAVISEFLEEYPLMRIRPGSETATVITGTFRFSSTDGSHQVNAEEYKLEIWVPSNFPEDLPAVYETDEKIPKSGAFHINGDSSFCLGSPLRLKIVLSKAPTLLAFTEKCLIPYLHAVTLKLRDEDNFPFGELQHGVQGLISDYGDLLKVKTVRQIYCSLKILSRFNLHSTLRAKCPCGCRKKLRDCSYYSHLKTFVNYASQQWYANQATFFLEQENVSKKKTKKSRKKKKNKD